MASQAERVYLSPKGPTSVNVDYGKNIESINRSASTLRDVVRQYKELKSLDDDTLAKMAVDHAKLTKPSSGHQSLKRAARQYFDALKNDRDTRLSFATNAINAAVEGEGGAFYFEDALGTDEQKAAIAQGRPWKRTETQALLKLAREAKGGDVRGDILYGNVPEELKTRYAELQNEELYGQSPFSEGGKIDAVLNVLTAPGRAGAGATAGALRTIKEAIPEEKIEPQAETGPSVMDRLGTALGKIAEAGLMASPALAIPTLTTKLVSRVDVPKMAGEAVSGAVKSGKVLDIPITGAVKAVAKDPSLPLKAAGASIVGAGKGLVGASDDKSSMSTLAKEAKNNIAKRAVQQAKANASINPGLDVKTEAKRIYNEALNSDMLASGLKDPEMLQALTEQATDPLNVLPAEKVVAPAVKAVTKAAKLTTLKAMPKFHAWVAENMRYAPDAADLGGEGGSLMRVAKEQATQAPKTLRVEAAPLLKKMNEVKDKKTLFKLLEGKLELTPELAADYGEAYKAGRDMDELLLKFSQETGIGSRFKGGLLKTAEDLKIENYVPHLVQTSKSNKGKLFDILKKRLSLQSRSALPRTVEHGTAIEDPAKQFRAAMEERTIKGAAAGEIKKNIDLLKKEELVFSYPSGHSSDYLMIGGKEFSKTEFISYLNKKSGKTWTDLGATLNDTVHRITGSTNDVRYATQFIVPEPVARTINKLAPVIAGSPNKVSSLASAYDGVANYIIRPFTGIFRSAVTLGGGTPYLARNAASVVGILGATTGLKGFKPSNLKQTTAAVVTAAGLGTEKAGAVTKVLADGSTVTMKQVVDFLGSVGALNQFKSKAGLDIVGRGPIATVRRGVDWLIEHSTPMAPGVPVLWGKAQKIASVPALNNAIENTQKITHFLTFLEDSSIKGYAKALDKMSELGGNYNRLSDFEKNVVRDWFAFYGWSRYILPLMAKQVVYHPERFAPWARNRQYHERSYGATNPAWKDLAPKYIRGLAVPAPTRWQPEKHEESRDPDKHAIALMTIEDPLSLLFSPLQPLLDSKGRGFVDMLAPTALLGMELFSGMDTKTGEPVLDIPWDVDELTSDLTARSLLTRSQASPIAKALLAPTTRMSRHYRDIGRLLFEFGAHPGDAFDHVLRYRMGRDLSVMGVFSTKAEGSPVPGVSTYPVDLLKEAAKRERQATQNARDVLNLGNYNR